MFSLIKKAIILIMSTPLILGNFIKNSEYCVLLRNQECKVRKVIVDNDYMTFQIKLKLINVLEVVMTKITLILKFVYQIVLKILV